MPEAFHCRLKGPVLVDRKTLLELQGFQAVSGAGGLWVQGAGQGPTGERALAAKEGRPSRPRSGGWGSNQHDQGSAGVPRPPLCTELWGGV